MNRSSSDRAFENAPPSKSAVNSDQYRESSIEVLAKGVDCDIALLTVENEKFWKGAELLQFGSLPQLQIDSLK